MGADERVVDVFESIKTSGDEARDVCWTVAVRASVVVEVGVRRKQVDKRVETGMIE